METITEILNSLENIKHRADLISDNNNLLRTLYGNDRRFDEITADIKCIKVAAENIINQLVSDEDGE